MYDKSRSLRHLTLIGVVGLIAGPSIGAAANQSDPLAPIAAADPDCDEKSSISLEIDVATGKIYLDEGNQGLTLIDDDLDVYFGSLTNVDVILQFSTGEWIVALEPENGAVQSRQTVGGVVRHRIGLGTSKYVLSSAASSQQSTMLNMTPVVPDIVLRPKPDCPPST
ncbi:hypothetical protein ACNOYE_23620 [Nannocystaceae bacterium ST9]